MKDIEDPGKLPKNSIKSSDANDTQSNITDNKVKINLDEKSSNSKSLKRKGKCFLYCVIFTTLFLLFIIDILLATIFFYYNGNCKNCEAKLYTKVKTVIKIYIAILIIKLVYLFFSYMIDLTKSKGLKILGFIMVFLTTVATLVLHIVNIVIVQKNYNKTKSWKNCGSFKGWMVFWLIVNYIQIFTTILIIICNIIKKKKNS